MANYSDVTDYASLKKDIGLANSNTSNDNLYLQNNLTLTPDQTIDLFNIPTTSGNLRFRSQVDTPNAYTLTVTSALNITDITPATPQPSFTIGPFNLQLGDGTTDGSIAGNLRVDDGGVLIFNNKSDSTYTGTLSVEQEDDAILNNVAGTTVTFTGAGSSSVPANPAGTAIRASTNNAYDLTIGGAGNVVVSGVIADGGTPALTGNIEKIGTGTWTFSGANTYVGITTVAEGTLVVANSAGLGATTNGTSTAAETIVNEGATLALTGNIAIGAEPLVLGATGDDDTTTTPAADDTPALLNLSGSNTYAGNITLVRDTTIASSEGSFLGLGGTINSDTDGTFLPALTLDGDGFGAVFGNIASGIASVTKEDDGTWTLSGTNSYAGGTFLNGGELDLSNAASAGSGAITYGDGKQTLGINVALASGTTFANALADVGTGDELDLRDLAYSPDATATVAGATLTVTSGGVSNSFALINPSAKAFDATADGSGGVLVTGVNIAPSLFGSTTYTTSSTGGQVYALYETILGRAPDPLGLENQVAAIEGGAPLTTVAQSLLDSAEYANDYGSSVSSNSGYVAQLYQDGLHRAPDSGSQGFVDALNAGTQTRAQVAISIATSQESSNDLAPTFNAGVFVPDASDSAVARLYYGLLDRVPDASGLAAQEAAVDGGASIGQLVQSFLASDEYRTTFVGQDNLDYVNGLYQTALGRAGDAASVSAFQGNLDTGAESRASTAVTFLTSSEFQTDEMGASNNDYINKVYQAALGRDADADGLANWNTQLMNGVTRSEVARDIIGSNEFATNVTAKGQATFVTALFEGALGRDPGSSELQSYQTALSGGASQASVAAGIAESPEAMAHLVPKIEAGMHVA